LTSLQPITDPANWRADDIANGEGWLFTLSAAQIEDLRQMGQRALDRVGGECHNLLQLSVEDVDPAGFAPTLEAIRATITAGVGFALMRGLPASSMPPALLAAIYWSIGLHLGRAQPNNPQGDMLGHVTDLGKTQSDPKSRGYQTREAMDYHCDQCDIVGLYCVRPAKSGGLSKLASSVAMYNTLLGRHPELAQALAQPLYWTKHGEHAVSELPYYTSPVFNFDGGKISTSFGPKHILKGHDLPETPALTDLQRTAITTAEDIADELHLSMELQAGDMQFVNNYTILHTRTAYEDYPESSHRRLLWRLWLMADGMRMRTDYARQWEKGVKADRAAPRLVI